MYRVDGGDHVVRLGDIPRSSVGAPCPLGMNAVHPQHRPERCAQLRHFVLAFHDSTSERVARSYDFVLASGPLDRIAGQMLSLVREGIR